MGSDLGHLSHLRLPIEQAVQLGHEVYLAARDLHRVAEVMGHLTITCLQAPYKQDSILADQAAFPSYTHMLVRQCFSSADELEVYVRAWRAIFDLVKPDLVLFEHSPSALIAARDYGFKKILVGNGFFIPPRPRDRSEPFAPFVNTARVADVMEGLKSDDAVLLTVINMALQRVGAQGFETLHDVYAQADEQFLMTWPVLDHFGERPGQRYLGVAMPQTRPPPKWPPAGGPKVFAYLHPFASLEILLKDLAAAKVCVLLYVRGLPLALRQVYTSERLHFTDTMVDLSSVADQAAWVINHGNHNTVANFVLSGVPQLLIPRHQEHLFSALSLVKEGCALMAYQDQAGYAAEIDAMNRDHRMRERAGMVQARCASVESLDSAGFVMQSFQALLGTEQQNQRALAENSTDSRSVNNLRLDLGCGRNKRAGFIGVDAVAFVGVDLIFDLRQEIWPWQDNSVQEIFAGHFIEHLTGRERIAFFNSLFRVMATGASATLITPHWSHECAYGDPTHEWPPVTSWTYHYLNRAWREAHAAHVGYTCDFYIQLMTRPINSATELIAKLTKRT
jgi:hypothetical protein